MALITYKETLSFLKGNTNCFLCLSNQFNGSTYTTTIGQKGTYILWIEANQIPNQGKMAEVAFLAKIFNALFLHQLSISFINSFIHPKRVIPPKNGV